MIFLKINRSHLLIMIIITCVLHASCRIRGVNRPFPAIFYFRSLARESRGSRGNRGGCRNIVFIIIINNIIVRILCGRRGYCVCVCGVRQFCRAGVGETWSAAPRYIIVFDEYRSQLSAIRLAKSSDKSHLGRPNTAEIVSDRLFFFFFF